MRAGDIHGRGIFAKFAVLLAILVGFLTRIPAGFAANPEISTIVFNPTPAKVVNPESSADSSPPQKVTLRFRAYDGFGNIITPSTTNPMTINVYGAPTGVITPTSTSITSGSRVTFAYNGQFFPNPITVEAYVPNGLGGYSIGVTQILAWNQPSPCTYGTESFTLPFDCGGLTGSACSNSNIANGLNLMAAIGYNDDKKASNNLS